MAKVDTIYIGTRDNVLAEASAWDPRQIGVAARECKYLLAFVGDADWDTEWFPSKAQALAAAQIAAAHHNAPVVTLWSI